MDSWEGKDEDDRVINEIEEHNCDFARVEYKFFVFDFLMINNK